MSVHQRPCLWTFLKIPLALIVSGAFVHTIGIVDGSSGLNDIASRFVNTALKKEIIPILGLEHFPITTRAGRFGRNRRIIRNYGHLLSRTSVLLPLLNREPSLIWSGEGRDPFALEVTSTG